MSEILVTILFAVASVELLIILSLIDTNTSHKAKIAKQQEFLDRAVDLLSKASEAIE